MAELLGWAATVFSALLSIYKDDDLNKLATCAENAQVQTQNVRGVKWIMTQFRFTDEAR